MAGGKFSEAQLFGMTIRESADDGSDFTNPSADYRRLFLGEDGNLHLKDSAGTVTDVGGGSGDVATDTIWNAKGDLAAGTGSDTADRLAVGASNGMGLVVDSTQTTGLAWRIAEWDRIIRKASDDTVTNSATLTADSELTFAVGGSTEVWRFEAMILYDSTLSGDYKCDFTGGGQTFSATFRYLGSDTTANAVLVSTGIRDSGVTTTTDIAAGGTSGGTVRFILIEGVFHAFGGSATMTFRFAQNTQTAAESAVTKIGSVLKLKRLV